MTFGLRAFGLNICTNFFVQKFLWKFPYKSDIWLEYLYKSFCTNIFGLEVVWLESIWLEFLYKNFCKIFFWPWDTYHFFPKIFVQIFFFCEKYLQKCKKFARIIARRHLWKKIDFDKKYYEKCYVNVWCIGGVLRGSLEI